MAAPAVLIGDKNAAVGDSSRLPVPQGTADVAWRMPNFIRPPASNHATHAVITSSGGHLAT
jgi:hypothetical protein